MTKTLDSNPVQRVAELEKQLQELQQEYDLVESVNKQWLELVDGIRVPVFVHDQSFCITRVNRAYAEVAGRPIKELLGKPYYEIFPVQDGPLESCAAALHAHKESFLEEITLESGEIYQSHSFPVSGYHDSNQHFVHIMENITERKRADQLLFQTNRLLFTLTAGNQALMHAGGEEELLQNVCNALIQHGGYCCAWVNFLEDENNASSLQPIASAGFQAEEGEQVPMFVQSGLCHQAAIQAVETAQPVLINDVFQVDQGPDCHTENLKQGVCSLLSVPLIHRDHRIGSLSILANNIVGEDEREQGLLTGMASDLSYGIMVLRSQQETQNLHLRLEDALVRTIQVASLTIEKRDPYTAGHQQRVTDLAVAIAYKMGLEEGRIQGLRMGGLIHDIGKIYVPSEILNRPGRLTEAEFNLIKSHSQIGYDIVKDVDFNWPVADMVHQHHERLDGSGYPQGLKNGEILLESRILAVADVVEAINSHRPYRPGLGMEVALDEITKNKGKFYDPDAVDACVDLVQHGEFSFMN